MEAVSDFEIDVCSSCRKPIIWCVTTRARQMPVNADPEPGGNIAVDPRPGLDPLARVLSVTAQFGRTNLRKSHFVDCPQADKWRRRS